VKFRNSGHKIIMAWNRYTIQIIALIREKSRCCCGTNVWKEQEKQNMKELILGNNIKAFPGRLFLIYFPKLFSTK
jgi:hypothetical protein